MPALNTHARGTTSSPARVTGGGASGAKASHASSANGPSNLNTNNNNNNNANNGGGDGGGGSGAAKQQQREARKAGGSPTRPKLYTIRNFASNSRQQRTQQLLTRGSGNNGNAPSGSNTASNSHPARASRGSISTSTAGLLVGQPRGAGQSPSPARGAVAGARDPSGPGNRRRAGGTGGGGSVGLRNSRRPGGGGGHGGSPLRVGGGSIAGSGSSNNNSVHKIFNMTAPLPVLHHSHHGSDSSTPQPQQQPQQQQRQSNSTQQTQPPGGRLRPLAEGSISLEVSSSSSSSLSKHAPLSPLAPAKNESPGDASKSTCPPSPALQARPEPPAEPNPTPSAPRRVATSDRDEGAAEGHHVSTDGGDSDLKKDAGLATQLPSPAQPVPPPNAPPSLASRRLFIERPPSVSSESNDGRAGTVVSTSGGAPSLSASARPPLTIPAPSLDTPILVGTRNPFAGSNVTNSGSGRTVITYPTRASSGGSSVRSPAHLPSAAAGGAGSYWQPGSPSQPQQQQQPGSNSSRRRTGPSTPSTSFHLGAITGLRPARALSSGLDSTGRSSASEVSSVFSVASVDLQEFMKEFRIAKDAVVGRGAQYVSLDDVCDILDRANFPVPDIALIESLFNELAAATTTTAGGGGSGVYSSFLAGANAAGIGEFALVSSASSQRSSSADGPAAAAAAAASTSVGGTAVGRGAATGVSGGSTGTPGTLAAAAAAAASGPGRASGKTSASSSSACLLPTEGGAAAARAVAAANRLGLPPLPPPPQPPVSTNATAAPGVAGGAGAAGGGQILSADALHSCSGGGGGGSGDPRVHFDGFLSRLLLRINGRLPLDMLRHVFFSLAASAAAPRAPDGLDSTTTSAFSGAHSPAGDDGDLPAALNSLTARSQGSPLAPSPRSGAEEAGGVTVPLRRCVEEGLAIRLGMGFPTLPELLHALQSAGLAERYGPCAMALWGGANSPSGVVVSAGSFKTPRGNLAASNNSNTSSNNNINNNNNNNNSGGSNNSGSGANAAESGSETAGDLCSLADFAKLAQTLGAMRCRQTASPAASSESASPAAADYYYYKAGGGAARAGAGGAASEAADSRDVSLLALGCVGPAAGGGGPSSGAGSGASGAAVKSGSLKGVKLSGSLDKSAVGCAQ